MNTPSDIKPAGPQEDCPPWDPDHPAVYVERETRTGRVTLVRHDSYPYVDHSIDRADEQEALAELFEIANRYLGVLNKRLNLLQAWLDTLGNPLEKASEGNNPDWQLRWFHGRDDPRDSYWVKRYAGLDDDERADTCTVRDRTAVLLAGLCTPWGAEPDGLFRFYGGQGLRVVAQVRPAEEGRLQVRITGVSSTLPNWSDKGERASSEKRRASLTVDMFDKVRKLIPAAFGLPDEDKVVEQGYMLPDSLQEEELSLITFSKTAPSPDDEYASSAISYLLVARWHLGPFPKFRIEPLAKRAMLTFADADVYVQDPVSKNGARDFISLRPSRSWKNVLDPEADKQQPLGTLPPGTTAANMAKLENSDFQVTNARLVDPPLPENATKEVPDTQPRDPSIPHVRTNRFAAANAYYHTSDLFGRMRRYGLDPAAYFRFVDRPILVRYRSGIYPGAGDGRTVNAQVRWTLRPDGGGKGAIEICFALGDLQSAIGRLPASQPSAAERSPLGVASDPRWCWHEYCHVLLTAAVGELEFRFAHSAGDAMAAILCDPDSRLTYDRADILANSGPWRGVTFPWVFIPRRHDRDVQCGWGWTGPMNSRDRYFSIPGMSDKRGYWTEQILSSSLFRLYRAIGGDSELRGQTGNQEKDSPARKNAADYAVYLIMRAIQSLGAASVTPSTTPNDFVDAMRKADTATASAPGPGGYVGGTVHKVVQWAFERQGLYGLPVPNSPVIGPEEIATVDLHIDDQRLKPDGPYSPVDLNGTAWQAGPNAVWASNAGSSHRKKVHVRVQNRGVDKARNTRVDVWCAKLTAGTIPKYPDASWQFLGSDTRNVPPQSLQIPGEKKFGPFEFTPDPGSQEYAILASASCDADRSNIDPATFFPCVNVPSPIQFLVACDNNLGLIKIKTP